MLINDLFVNYADQPVIENMQVSLASSDVTALIGPNGVGKSTLLKAIAGLLSCEGGFVLDDKRLLSTERRQLVSYMPQDTSAKSSLTLLEVVLLGRLNSLTLRMPSDVLDQAYTALDQFGLGNLATRTLDGVSGGQRQLVYLAQALFSRPRILLLDEPTAALDLKHQLIVLQTIQKAAQQQSIIVVVAMHDLSLAAQFANSFICLHNGKVDCTGPAERVLTKERLARLYNVDVEIIKGKNGCLRITPLQAIEH